MSSGDKVYLTTQPGSLIDNSGNITLFCNQLSLDGGSITGTGQLLVSGARGPASDAVVFGPGLAPSPAAGVTDAVYTGGASLSGTVPAGWTLVSTGALDVQPGMVNLGRVDFNGGYDFYDAGGFVNKGIFAITGKSGANSNDIEARRFTNYGTLTASGPGTVFGNYADAPGASFTFYNRGTFLVEPGALVVFGQSNGSYCVDQHDPVTLVQEPGSTIDNHGSVDFYCNRLDIDGGKVVGSAPVSVNAAQGPGSVTVSFAPGLSLGTGSRGALGTYDATLAGTIPSGWDVDATGDLVTAPGAKNAGTLVLAGNAELSGPGRFVNNGTMSLAGASLDEATFVNNGVVSLLPNFNPVSGNVTLGSAGTLEETLASATSFGKLGDKGTVRVSGTLVVGAAEGFAPTAGDTFELLYGNSVSGRFTQVRAPGQRRPFHASYTSSAIVLSP